MLDLTLQERIYTFIRKFLLVKERQVYKFFGEEGRDKVTVVLNDLKHKRKVFEHPDECLSTVRTLPTSRNNYMDIIQAVDVMCRLPASKINAFDLQAYPLEITFVTTDDVLHDVEVFNRINWVSKYSLTARTRRKTLPDGESDPINHIAVIEDESLMEKVEPLGFSMFVVVDRNGGTEAWTYDD